MKRAVLGVGLWLGSVCIAPYLVGGCGTDRTQRASAPGTLRVALSGTAASGVQYRLTDGIFQITGASTVQVRTNDHAESELINLELEPGEYSISLNPGWSFERETAGGSFESVEAVLLSANPQPFSIEQHATSRVSFRFRTGPDVIQLGNGAVAIGIDVEEADASAGGAGPTGGAGGASTSGGQGAGGASVGVSAVFEVGPMLPVARMSAPAINLQDGRTLLFGGHGTDFVSLASAELFDPTNNSLVSLSMQEPRDGSGVQRLADGRYLIVGGTYDLGVPGYRTAEVFDPRTLTFSATGTMVRPRSGCDAELLPDGRVVVVGGWYSEDSATYGEVYDPAAGTFSATGALNVPRSGPVLLPTADGRIAVLGGDGPYGGGAVDSVEVYDPSANTFTVLRDSLVPTAPSLRTVSGWLNGRVDEYKLSDGRYLLLAYSDLGHSLVAFNPETLDVTPVSGPDQISNPLVIDSTRDLVYVPYQPAQEQLVIARFDVGNATMERLPVSGFAIGYSLDFAGMTFVDATRIWFPSGTSCSGSQTNFCPVRDTFFVRLVTTP